MKITHFTAIYIPDIMSLERKNIMKDKFYTAKYDRVFKAIFCDEDNKELLREFLSRTLKRKVEIIEFLRNELKVTSTMDKVKVVDVLVKVDDEYLHIELNSNSDRYLHSRNFIYFTNIYSRKIVRNEMYDYKTKFLHIDLTYGMSKKIDDVSYYYLMDKNSRKYIENIEIIEFNMDKIMNYWYNLDNKKVNEYKHLIMLDLDKTNLKKISKGDDFVEEFEKKVTDLNEQETFKSAMTYEEDQKLIQNTEKRIAYEEGTKQGMEQRNIEIAKNMLNLNLPIESISKITGLDIDTIKELSKK